MGCQKLIDLEGKARVGPVSPAAQASSNDSQEKGYLLERTISRNGNSLETEPFVAWESENLRSSNAVSGRQGARRGSLEGIEVRGSASFKLAAKMKEIKQKLKVWNKEVFGRLDYNKSSALQQVDFWDRMESERSLTLLSEDTGWKVDIGRLQLDQISQQEAENLESLFTEDEVHAALMEMNGDKALGPDDFTMAFWQSCWDFVKEEILEMFKEFHKHSSFLKSLNNTFGLRINLAKSETIPIGEVEEIEELAVELGCRVGSLSSQYLGLPLGATNRAPYIMPKIVARRLEKVQRDFLWGGGNLKGKIHLVNWEVVCTDKENGGLGLRKLAMLNKALLGNRIWRDFNDWELDMVGDLLHMLRGHRPSLEEDSIFLRQGRNGQFRVKEAYSLLTNPNDTGFSSRSIWVARVPTKVASLLGRRRGGMCLLWIDYKEEGCNFRIVVFCVGVKKKM
ncbi:hypothetical protein CK203_102885 [Vitis vinifera]|uniref:Uncharacterized protein n=1 Tax=Vitis vinifera TaxID=29760 RepID=A0A438C5H8_VITVI|nr:hypothetical protein CK203_102885 [Vitis vinifera]